MILQVGVKALLKNKEGKILLLKRASEKYGEINGMWDIVGGRIEPGISLLENLKREIQEETKLILTTQPLLIAAQDIIPNDERHVVRLTYVAKIDGEPELDGLEHSEYKWVTFKELSEELNLDTYVVALIEKDVLSEESWSM